MKAGNSNSGSSLPELVGFRYWSASVLPALVGTTLPFWLSPPGFKFRPVEAILFLIATLFAHSGFFLLYAGFRNKLNSTRTRKRVFSFGAISLVLSVLTGAYLNSSLHLHRNVPEYIFAAYGISILFAGMLYVFPPFSFYRHTFGEMIICVGLGMLPVLGAYLVQVGDLTRTVYLASLPVVASTGLWLWITELINRPEDERSAYRTLVMHFSHGFSGRYVTLFLILSIYAALLLAVFGRSSLNPLSLTALVSAVPAIMIIRTLWNDYQDPRRLVIARKYSILIHLFVSAAIIAACLSSAS